MPHISFWLCLHLVLTTLFSTNTSAGLSLIFPSIKSSSSQYVFNPEAVTLVDDVWIKIGEHLDGPTLWNISLVNKYLGALFRGPTGISRILEYMGQYQLLNILESSELKISSDLIQLFRDSPGWATYWARNHPEFRENLYSLMQRLTMRLQDKAGDWIAYYYFLTEFFTVPTLKIESLGQSILEDIWSSTSKTAGGSSRLITQNFYLPEPNGQRLFDRIDPKLVAQITFSQCPGQSSMFFPLLLADYVLPSYRDDLEIGSYEKGCLRMIFRYRSVWFRSYFTRLMLALYMSSGSVGEIQPMCRFLSEFGFIWKKLVREVNSEEYFQELLDSINCEELNVVLAIASQWKLDVAKIHERAQSIMKQASPELSESHSKINAKNMRYLMCTDVSMDHSKMLYMHFIDGELCGENSERHREILKRKRDEDSGNAVSKRLRTEIEGDLTSRDNIGGSRGDVPSPLTWLGFSGGPLPNPRLTRLCSDKF